MKEGLSGLNLGTTLFAYARGVRKSLFRCSNHEETEVMAIWLCDAEIVVRDLSFFMNFIFVCGDTR